MSEQSRETVLVPFTQEEAWELLARCLASSDPDTPALRSAMQKLARIVEPQRRERSA